MASSRKLASAKGGPSSSRKRRGGRLAQYRQKAELLRLQLERRGHIAAGELDAYWPGGGENSDRGLDGWVRCLCNYARFLERGSAPAATPVPLAEAEQAAMAALERRVASVTLTAVSSDGGPLTVSVHPKGLVALERLQDRGRAIAYLASEVAALAKQEQTPELLEVLSRAGAELTYQYRLIAWTVTSPGAGLPFPEDAARPALPTGAEWQWLHELTTLDYYLLADACQTLHARRLLLLEGLLAPDDAPAGALRRPSFAEFAAAYSEQRHVAPATLLRDFDLPGVIAAAKLAASAQRRALREAEAAADAKARAAGRGRT